MIGPFSAPCDLAHREQSLPFLYITEISGSLLVVTLVFSLANLIVIALESLDATAPQCCGFDLAPHL